jgi:hypothetical protein
MRNFALMGLALLAAGCSVQTNTAATNSAANGPAKQPDYHPSLGELMTMAVQPRHTKLGLAAKARNWDYLAYETKELKGAFDRIVELKPTYRKNPMAPLVNGSVEPTLDALDAAVKAKDAAAFDAAYADLTKACNTCHQQLDHTFLVIKAPDGAAYPDQDFRGPKPDRK